jgi:hypothetical protein
MKKALSCSTLSLTEVGTLDRATLTGHWLEIYGHPPPAQISIGMLRLAIGWHAQAQKHGGLDAACRKMLQAGTTSPLLEKGTRLIREWQGISHQVTVLSQGFEYAGERYRSLSAIARRITGTAWNGWVFFGVKR